MVSPDVEMIRNSPPARSLLLGRAVAATLRAEGWTVREGAAHSSGIADAAAEKTWCRKGFQARVRILARCHHAPEGIVFSPSTPRADALHVYGDRPVPDALLIDAGLDPASIPDRIHVAATRMAPPKAQTSASAFREPTGAPEPFRTAAEEAFAAPSAIAAELAAYDADVFTDDLNALSDRTEKADYAIDKLAAMGRHTELLHSVLVTDATLWTIADEKRIARVPSLRLYRSRVTTTECTWIDVVQAEAFAAYAAATSRHYTTTMARRGFTSIAPPRHSRRSNIPRNGIRTQSGR